MELFDIAEAEPIQVTIPGIGPRVVAHVFPHPSGIVFADPGWCQADSTGHPFHVIEGTLEETAGGWAIGGVVFTRIPEQDDLALDWGYWKQYQTANDPNGRCGRAAAIENARADLGF